MKILFTGASSFTGYWFVRELSAAGYQVTAVFRGVDADAYEGVRAQRVREVLNCCRAVFDCSFGDAAFDKGIREGGPWDMLCHHAADVTNYKSDDFDVAAALANNTRNLRQVLEALQEQQCRRVLLTGSVFEQDEGSGSDGLRAFSPYGLSKGLTAQVFRYYAQAMGLTLGKFVIPNPFGPLEEPRFTSYLARSWLSGQSPEVRTPDYVRDNIHVSLLAKAYVDFAARVAEAPAGHFLRINPSGYPESMGAFTARFAEQMRPRLSLPCEFQLPEQQEFAEPLRRINTDVLNAAALGWSEQDAWDELAEYYVHTFGGGGA